MCVATTATLLPESLPDRFAAHVHKRENLLQLVEYGLRYSQSDSVNATRSPTTSNVQWVNSTADMFCTLTDAEPPEHVVSQYSTCSYRAPGLGRERALAPYLVPTWMNLRSWAPEAQLHSRSKGLRTHDAQPCIAPNSAQRCDSERCGW